MMTTTVKSKREPKARSAAKKFGMVDPAGVAPVYIDPAQKALVDSFCDLLPDSPYTVDDYLREKHAGIDAVTSDKHMSGAADIAEIMQIR
jgi:hypothetical protein